MTGQNLELKYLELAQVRREKENLVCSLQERAWIVGQDAGTFFCPAAHGLLILGATPKSNTGSVEIKIGEASHSLTYFYDQNIVITATFAGEANVPYDPSTKTLKVAVSFDSGQETNVSIITNPIC